MSISVMKDNCICYPTEVYYKYNLYLIREYKLFKYKISKLNLGDMAAKRNKKYCEGVILELCELLEDNISHDTSNIFSTMDWEENLHRRYENLINFYDKLKNRFDEYGMKCFIKKIKTIEIFLRQEKLERINECR